MEPRHWKITIPVRPKAVQSTRFDRGGFHADRKVREWKAQILPYIKAAAEGLPPSTLPIRMVSVSYVYKLPKSATKKVVAAVQRGDFIPYTAAGDLTDNLNKGLVDVCKEVLFTDDRMIVQTGGSEKRYGLEDRIDIEFEEIPGLMSVEGKPLE